MQFHASRQLLACALAAVLFLAAACSRNGTEPPAGSDASPSVLQANAALAKELKLDDQQDFEDARRGFMAKPTGKILAADGTVLKDFDVYGFLNAKAAETVNPSLWRHAQLNAQVGLYKVVDGVYQLRGFDIANLTLIEGKTGWIVVDTLTARESAQFAMAFAEKHLGRKPISAMIFTHAHVDHFGGALGLLSPAEVEQRKIPVVAPAGFIEEGTSENILAGVGMGRRSIYQFGRDLPRSAKGNVDTGLGKDVVYGAVGMLVPNRLIIEPTQNMEIDGVNFVFHNVPNAECPAELTFSIPNLKLYDGAENLSQTMHNLLPIRGAKVRDALRWSSYMQQALDQMDGIDVYIASHNWPIWGNTAIRKFITVHRDVYKYMHDQTVRLLNQGYSASEIADMVKLPQSLAQHLGARGYYGDLRHNVKAIYQFYLGFYDGNPANLNALPPAESAKRYIELIGADKVLAAAQAAYDKGDYRWAAELLNHAVFADSANKTAKELLAKTYDQMGYMAESATWRNSYLTGALELRSGAPTQGVSRALMIDMLLQTPTDRFLEAMAANLNGANAEGKNLKVNLVLSDKHENYVLWIENAVLHFKSSPPASDANATLTLTYPLLAKMFAGTAGVKETLMGDELKVTGSVVDLVRFFSLIEIPEGKFPIVTR
ncbi:MAG: alkyl sulfatase dimerization domain-containing protein [Comamonadaceae bacterium]